MPNPIGFEVIPLTAETDVTMLAPLEDILEIEGFDRLDSIVRIAAELPGSLVVYRTGDNLLVPLPSFRQAIDLARLANPSLSRGERR